MEIIFLIILALAPCVAFMGYILYMDREEPEPMDLILKVLVLGALICFPAGIIENVAMQLFPILKESITLQCFLLIGPVEEIAKFFIVMTIAWPNKVFNEENEGIVYSTVSAIGFAALENVFYVLEHGFTVGIFRAIVSVPLHVVCGIFMGEYIGAARFTPDLKERNKLLRQGVIRAILIHGLFNWFVFSGDWKVSLIFPLIFWALYKGYYIIQHGRQESVAYWGYMRRKEAIAASGYNPDDYNYAANENNIVITNDEIDYYRPVNENIADEDRIPFEFREENAEPVKPKKWKIFLSRSIFGFCVGLWILAYHGVETGTMSFNEYMLGGMVVTILPAILGLTLEVSYNSEKKKQFRNN